jgi:hypothetical protein
MQLAVFPSVFLHTMSSALCMLQARVSCCICCEVSCHMLSDVVFDMLRVLGWGVAPLIVLSHLLYLC